MSLCRVPLNSRASTSGLPSVVDGHRPVDGRVARVAEGASVPAVRAPSAGAVLVIPEAKTSDTPSPEVTSVAAAPMPVRGQVVRPGPWHVARREEDPLKGGPELLGEPAVEREVARGAHSQEGVAH